MPNLLSAGFMRLRKSRLFRLFIIGEAVWGATVAWFLYQYGNLRENQNLYFLMPMLYGCIIESVFCGFFIGTDYSDGTVRNKLVVGSKRAEVYLSNLVICCFAGLAVFFTHMAVYSLLGFILVGAEIFPQMLLLKLICAGVSAITYAAFFTMISTVISRIATAVAANIFISFGLLGAGMYAYAVYREPPLLSNGAVNPHYVGGAARAVLSFFKAVLPSSAALDAISGKLQSDFLRVIFCSLAAAAVFTLIGLGVFRRKNIN